MLTQSEWLKSIDVQDACNGRGVVRSLVEAMDALAAEGLGTDEINSHPVVRLYVCKLADLAHLTIDVDEFGHAYRAVREALAAWVLTGVAPHEVPHV